MKRDPLEGISGCLSNQYSLSEVACGFYLESVHCLCDRLDAHTDRRTEQAEEEEARSSRKTSFLQT